MPTTLSEAIYQYLKNAIIKGDLKPGERLQEKSIATLFNSSSTPVREAFFRLAAEKFIVINARREVLIRQTSHLNARELYEIVRALDRLAVANAVTMIGAGEVSLLREMTRRLEDCFTKNSNQEYLDQNIRIHNRIWQSCGNASLYELLLDLMDKIAIYRRHVGLRPFENRPALEKSLRDHLRLVDLLEARDVTGLMDLIASHWGEEFIHADAAGDDAGRPRTVAADGRRGT